MSTALAVGVSLLTLGTVTPSADAAAPVGQGFNLNRSDLRHILRQIKISEQHVVTRTPEQPCATLLGPGPNQIPNQTQQGAELPLGLRTVDGTCNNLLPGQEKFGAADTVFPRMVPAKFRAADNGTSYASTSGTVRDAKPRIASNLIVDQTEGNPAAVAASDGGPADEAGNVSIPNVAPDVGLSAPFNSLFTFFGQFFDHGLDLVAKGGGTVVMPLQPDDPLFEAGSPTNFMILTRATNQPNGAREHTNTTTSFVDQNQTYTSHPSHQVFLREYEADPGTGFPVDTGRMIGGEGGEGLATWEIVKAQALEQLGIVLTDLDVTNVPLLDTDPYGNFTPGPNGFPQIVTASGLVEGSEAGTAIPANAVRTGHAFLDDIAHHAAPTGDRNPNDGPGPIVPLDPDDDPGTDDDGDPTTYDDEMLNAHFIAGDGRANENVGLTAVHHVFHSEHNRLVDDIDNLINTLETPENIADWHNADGAAWNYGQRLFAAARFVTEMEYQHLVFEEFARKIQPMVNVFGEAGVGYHTEIDPSIRAEFAHTVYRFGHSMLTEVVPRRTPTGGNRDIGLIDAFLDPPEFLSDGAGGTLSPDRAAGDIIRGVSRQVGNQIDEFVVEALRNNLLGLPLDLPTINMARGRDTGIPTLNEARRAFYNESHNSALQPYESWADFNFSLRNPDSLVNYIAAFGTHSSITGATTVADKRAAAQAILDAAADPDPAVSQPAYDFLNSVGEWENQDGRTITGLDDIDLWVGGLGEKPMVFGGMLGATMNYVFEKQMEDLQDGDRFYYLTRTAGLNLLTQLEGNSFAELVMRNTDVEGLPADAFSRPDFVFDMRNVGTSGAVLDDPGTDWNEATLLTRMPNGTVRFGGGEHTVFNGTANADRMWASEGDDTLRGNDGNDWMQGGDGNDNHVGGLGDDIMVDLAGDDVLKGGDDDDALSSGQGFGGDLNQGGRGQDFIVGGNDITETFGGPGNDFVFAGDAEDTVFGDDGDDWIEGGKGPFNFLNGDNGAPFADDLNEPGHDVLMSVGGEQDYDSEGGDDIMLMGGGIQRAEGHMGFDWSTHKDDPLPADSDMEFTGLLPEGLDNNRDRFDMVESLSGWMRNDVLRGDNRVAGDRGPEHSLTAEGVARINGLGALVPPAALPYNSGNIILGGAGVDVIEGRGGDDIVDGDSWLNVRLSVRTNPADPSTEIGSADGMGKPYLTGSTTTLQQAVFAGTVDPGNIVIVREIRTPSGTVLGANAALGLVNNCPARNATTLMVQPVAATTNCDTAEFSQPATNYRLEFNAAGPGSIRVVDLASEADAATGDGTDVLWNVDNLRFCQATNADGVCTSARDVVLPNAPTVTGVTPANTAATVSFTPGAANGATVTGFRAEALRANGSVAATATAGPNATSATINGLTNGTAYTVRVVALVAGADGGVDPGVESPPSNVSAQVRPAAAPAPTVVSSAPANESSGATPTGNIVVTFDQAILASSVTAATVVLTIDGQTTAIGRSATLSADGKTLTVDPTPTLALNTKYRLALNGTVTGSSAGLRNATGQRLVNTAVTFTTRTATAPFVASSVPANAATGVPVGDNLTVTFNEPVSGLATNTVVLTVDGQTTALGRTASISGNTLTIDPTQPLAPGTTYRLSLNGTVAGSTNGLRNADGVRLANTAITFTTVSDPVAPSVTAVNPADGATGAALIPAIRFDATERVTGVTATTFVVRNTTTNATVAGTLTSNAAGTRWTLTPSASLARLTTYRVTLTGGASAIRDVAGNPLVGNTGAGSSSFTWTFQTR